MDRPRGALGGRGGGYPGAGILVPLVGISEGKGLSAHKWR